MLTYLQDNVMCEHSTFVIMSQYDTIFDPKINVSPFVLYGMVQ